jgi:hypothetical protein
LWKVTAERKPPGAEVERRFDRLLSNRAVRLCYKENGREKSFRPLSARGQDSTKKWPVSGHILYSMRRPYQERKRKRYSGLWKLLFA